MITTFTGKMVNPLDLKVEDICIEDIAHHLALINRFVGSTRQPINVAQHSLYVMYLVADTLWEREALFHDATEAYLGDMSKWVKQMDCMAGYREAERNAWEVICKALDLRPEGDPSMNHAVRRADDLMVRFEYMKMLPEGHHHLFERPSHPRPTPHEIMEVNFAAPGHEPWEPWRWYESERRFLDTARELGIK